MKLIRSPQRVTGTKPIVGFGSKAAPHGKSHLRSDLMLPTCFRLVSIFSVVHEDIKIKQVREEVGGR